MDLIDNQVRALRKRQIMASFANHDRTGAYWGIWTDISHMPNALPCAKAQIDKLANISTRLEGLDSDTQQKLINWGYASCDATIRAYYQPALPTGKFPYAGGVG